MTTDDFLWSADPNHSAFWTATPTERRALGQEQVRLVSAVVRDHPIQVLGQFVSDGAAQAATLSLEDFDHKPTVRRSIAAWMTEPQGVVWRRSLAYHQAWPVHAMNLGLAAVLICSLVGLAALAAQTFVDRKDGAHEVSSWLLIAAFVIVTAVAANALVCGGLSGVIGRYQARIVAPLILLGVCAWIVVARRYGAPAADVRFPFATRRHLWSRNSV
jgi:small-conductance mechanosensitive channel